MKKIFISCSSKDSKAALTICEAIEARGYACWISSRDIGPGENFQEAIASAIGDAALMVLVFSANANNSGEIKKELALADPDAAGGDTGAHRASRPAAPLSMNWRRGNGSMCSVIGSKRSTVAGANHQDNFGRDRRRADGRAFLQDLAARHRREEKAFRLAWPDHASTMADHCRERDCQCDAGRLRLLQITPTARR